MPLLRVLLPAAGTAFLLMPGVFAAEPKTLACQDSGGNRDSHRVCEMREMTLGAPGKLSVDASPNGGINVSGESRGDILVRAKVEANAPSESEAKSLLSRITIRTAGGDVSADGPTGLGRHTWWSVSYEIHTPQRIDLNLKTVNGGIGISSVGGDVAFRTTNGSVTLTGLSGKVTGGATNGGLMVTLDGDRWNGEMMDVHTTNGGVQISMPANYSARLEAGTVNGGFSSDLPVAVSGAMDKKNIDASLGSGGAPIRVHTTNGGIRIRRKI
ncbi:MAG: DUF4097 family beta strand repeat protein [Bryobacterales bacterium]|nr:DUF4097 family beta strand repeat protein [Bryobacterales bacterium]